MVTSKEDVGSPPPTAGVEKLRIVVRILVPFFNKLARFVEMIHPKMSVIDPKEPMRR